jgi:hypothetical protein
MNLNQEFPRSPKEKLVDLVHLPRMIDKVRAARQNTLGEYIYPCPLDKIMLDFLGVDSCAFQEKVCSNTEEVLSAWVASQCENRSLGDKQAVNNKILKGQPDSPEKWETFHEIRNRIDPSRTDLTTWVDLIDLEEGRL